MSDCLVAALKNEEWHPVRAPTARSRLLQVDGGAPEQVGTCLTSYLLFYHILQLLPRVHVHTVSISFFTELLCII